jgi:hypothetical protein
MRQRFAVEIIFTVEAEERQKSRINQSSMSCSSRRSYASKTIVIRAAFPVFRAERCGDVRGEERTRLQASFGALLWQRCHTRRCRRRRTALTLP